MNPAGHPYLDAPLPIVMAHRGYSPDGLENSMRAFAAALDLGVRYLETDVHGTSDGRLIAFHDARLDRVTNGRGDVRAMTWDQVRRARIGGVEPIPLLEEVLTAWPQVHLNVDVKSASAIRPMIELIRRRRCQERVLVSSFSDRRRGAVLAGLPDVGPLAWSPGIRGTWRVVKAARRGPAAVARALAGACCIQLPERLGPRPVVTQELVAAVDSAGAQVHVWTVDDPAVMTRLLDAGVHGIITNRSDLAMRLVRQRERGAP